MYDVTDPLKESKASAAAGQNREQMLFIKGGVEAPLIRIYEQRPKEVKEPAVWISEQECSRKRKQQAQRL